MRVEAPHASAIEEVARRLDGDPERGLSEEEAAARLARFGPNRLERARRPPYAAIALRQFTDPLVGLLIAAAAVSLLIAEGISAAAIGAIVLVNALLGFVQEAGAERAVLALREGAARARPIGHRLFQVAALTSFAGLLNRLDIDQLRRTVRREWVASKVGGVAFNPPRSERI